MRHNPDYGIMTKFVQRRPVPVDGLEIGLRWWHLHKIMRRAVEGSIATDPKIDACCADQGFDLWFDQAGRWRRGDRGDVFRQAVALVGIEHREALEEGDGIGFLTGRGSPLPFVLRRETVGIDDGGAAFALADIAAEAKGLAEREPALAGIAVLDH